MISVRFSESLSWNSASALSKKIESVAKEGNHILLVSGAIPMAEDGAYCRTRNKDDLASISDIITTNAEKASAVIACGSCAANGGIVNAFGQFQVFPLSNLLKNKQVVNIPGCPPHPDWILGPIISILLFGKFPKLDDQGRPAELFSSYIHDSCPRRGSFEEGDFAQNFADAQDGKCLYKLGCKGRQTVADCPDRKWNQKQSWCIQANSICTGCASDNFYDKLDPLFSPIQEKDIPVAGGLKARNIGQAVIIGTGVGIAANEVVKKIAVKRAESAEDGEGQ